MFFVLRIIKIFNSLLKLSYSYFLSFIIISLVRANSEDPGVLIYCHKDSFIGWTISREISKLGKKLKLQVKSDHMPVTDSYRNNRFNSNFDNLKIVFFTFTDHFQQNESYNMHNWFTTFQSSSQFLLEFYYHFQKLNKTSLNFGRKDYYCNLKHPS